MGNYTTIHVLGHATKNPKTWTVVQFPIQIFMTSVFSQHCWKISMDFKFLFEMLIPQNIGMGTVVFTKICGLAKS